MHDCSTKWGYYMFSLKHPLEDGTGTPHPDELPTDGFQSTGRKEYANLYDRKVPGEGLRR
jgi:hypothetical protein